MVYSVPIGNYSGFVMTFHLIVMEADRSSSLIAMKILQCYTRRFTEFSESELPNSTVIGVVLRLLINLTFAACAMSRS